MAATVRPNLHKGAHRKQLLRYKRGFWLFLVSFVLVIVVLAAVGAEIKLHGRVPFAKPSARPRVAPAVKAAPVPVKVTAPAVAPVKTPMIAWVMTLELPTAAMFTCADKAPASSGNSLFWAAYAECTKTAGVTKAAVVMWTYRNDAVN